VIVHADTDDIAVEACLGDGKTRVKEHPPLFEIRQDAVAVMCAAEIVIQIFDLESSNWKEHPFEAAAGGPAGARIGKSAKRSVRIGKAGAFDTNCVILVVEFV